MKSKTEEILEQIRVNNIRAKNYKGNIEDLEAINEKLESELLDLSYADLDYDRKVDGVDND